MKESLEVVRFLLQKLENVLLFQDLNKSYDNFIEMFLVFMTQHSPKQMQISNVKI